MAIQKKILHFGMTNKKEQRQKTLLFFMQKDVYKRQETYCTIVIEPEENVNGLKIYKNDEEFVLFSIELKDVYKRQRDYQS